MLDAAVSARSFIDAFHSDQAPDRARKESLYDWLVGCWEMDAVIYRNDGGRHSARGFVSAGSMLEGRAVEGVFAVPGLFYSTTLRIHDHDPAIDTWRILWTDPLNQVYCNRFGRASGDEIVQQGVEAPSLARLYGSMAASGSEVILRIFSDITPGSFR
jgi:hypothetical protein